MSVRDAGLGDIAIELVKSLHVNLRIKDPLNVYPDSIVQIRVIFLLEHNGLINVWKNFFLSQNIQVFNSQNTPVFARI